jgi:hypothetical protein
MLRHSPLPVSVNTKVGSTYTKLSSLKVLTDYVYQYSDFEKCTSMTFT